MIQNMILMVILEIQSTDLDTDIVQHACSQLKQMICFAHVARQHLEENLDIVLNTLKNNTVRHVRKTSRSPNIKTDS